jgi:hypothetical protein
VWIEARTKLPWAATVGPLQAQATLSLRALVTQARTTRAGHACLHQVVFDQGGWDGGDLGWLQQQGILVVVPAREIMAVTVAAQAQAAAGEGVANSRRVHPVRHGQGNPARPERLETEVVGIAGLTTDDQEGTPEHGRHANRRDLAAKPSHAVVVCPWYYRDDGHGGTPHVPDQRCRPEAAAPL